MRTRMPRGFKPAVIDKFGFAPDTKIKPVDDVDDHYITDGGDLISTKRAEPIIKATTTASEGHRIICLTHRSGEKVWHYLHHLVMDAFGPPKPYPEAMVLHRDDDKQNNAMSNLYWGNHRQNRLDAVRNGVTNPGALDDDDVRKIRLVDGLMSFKRMGPVFGVTPRYASQVARGKVRADVEPFKLPEDGVLVVRII
jgi:hypothetical protein